MRDKFLPFSPPLLGDDEIREVVDTLRSDWITTGPKTRKFEEEFAASVGSPAALALNSCTAGLHVALVTLGIGPGDEVVTTPNTFAASVNVIEHVGARPVLADIAPDTLNIDPAAVERAITPRTKAILVVHFAGHPADLDALRAIADARGIPIVEDAAHAVAARYKGTPIGGTGNLTSFSFYATKNLTTAEGGILTGSQEQLERARVISLHGMSRDAWKRYDKSGGWRYDILLPGFKYNMTDLQASLGLVQLRRLADLQARRRKVVDIYRAAFENLDALELPTTRPGVEHAWHLYVVRLRQGALTIDRDRFIEELKARNIGSSVHFIPIHMHSYYREKYGYRADDFPVASANFERVLSLPLSAAITEGDAHDVVAAVRDIVTEFRR
jgi:dTDP-4-amino-4,6-dideoxygalactose transaminase